LSQTILVLENKEAVRELAVFTLQRSGFPVTAARRSDEAECVLEQIYPCLILLSQDLTGPGNVDYAHRLANHERACAIPVITMVTHEENGGERGSSSTNVVDTLAVPFCGRELVTRVKTALGITACIIDEDTLQIDGLKLDPIRHRVSGFGKPIELDTAHFRMLYFFMRNPERSFTRSQLLDSIWGRNVYAEENLVEVHVRNLRKALAPVGLDWLIQSVNGSDFRLSTHSP